MTTIKKRTSKTDPLKIAEITVSAGIVGITFCPGKHQKDSASGRWERDLVADLLAIKQWGAEVIVCLLENDEIVDLGVEMLPALTIALGMKFHHLPIIDGLAPSKTFEATWINVSEELFDTLDRGGRVLVHCKGGLGRAGVVAAKMLISYGSTAHDAIAMVRRVRSANAIETRVQEQYLRTLAKQTKIPPRISFVAEHREPEDWVKCAIKLFRMVGVLHRRGYQRLRVSPTGRETWWRCAIAPAKIFSGENGALIEQNTPSMTALFGSGASCKPFEWRDSILHLEEEELADRFSRSFPVILRESAGRDWAYVGWYQELLNTLGSECVPIAHYWDAYENELYNPLRIFTPGSSKDGTMPLPPIFCPDDDLTSPANVANPTVVPGGNTQSVTTSREIRGL